ncbi:hypothetical protein EZS27_009734 [termite gut metagenome]|uniref:DUF4290 domain-containing protein n=1 Tax=termite gut metagenome TaxID=433724 RepID=A0A5J4S8R7_9ZZZZ
MLQYNTQRKRLPLPEYGRSIQNMVDHAMTIEDRAERQFCAKTIVGIMKNMYPNFRDVPEFVHKLWDHLAIMSDFKLDIDYPYEVIKKDNLVTAPDVISYPQKNIHHRHYGYMVEVLVKKVCEFDEGEEKDNLVALIANHMKKCYVLWNKETIDEQKVTNDLMEYSEGMIKLDAELIKLMETRYSTCVRKQKTHNNNNGNQKKHSKSST